MSPIAVRVSWVFTARGCQGNEDQFVYGGRAVLQEMLGIGPAVSEIAVTANDYRQVDELVPAHCRGGRR